MQGGCFKSLLASVGCLTLLVIGGLVGWHYRAQVAGLYRSLRGERAVAPADTVLVDTALVVPVAPRAADSATSRAVASRAGRASAAALRSARDKESAMARRDGPPYVVLTAEEMASLIRDGLDPVARTALDSVEVTLMADRFSLRGQLRTRLLEDMLGPLGGMLAEREPLMIAGPARVPRIGVVAWEPDSLLVRAFPFPRTAIPVMINRLTGGNDGTLQIGVPPTVGDLRIRPDGVTFYRRVQ